MSEQISALMDDEIAAEDAAHLIASMQSSKHSADVWSQYHLIGDVMRGNELLSKDFKSNLMLMLDQEPTVLAPKAAQTNADKTAMLKDKLPAKWSIAASLAAVMAVGWMAMHEMQADTQVPKVEIARVDTSEHQIPNEYIAAHQSSAPSASSYYIQSVSYTE